METVQRPIDVPTLNTDEFYFSIGDANIPDAFRNLDQQSNVSHLTELVSNERTKSFVVDFSDDTAWAAFDLPCQSLVALLNTPRPEALSTRWLNIFSPYHHRPLLEYLGRRYDFSPRLLALMSSEPQRNENVSFRTANTQTNALGFRKHPVAPEADAETQRQSDDTSEHSCPEYGSSIASGNLYKIVDSIWHYSSVDFGRQYICIGFNSLYGTNHTSSESEEPDITTSRLPHCIRVWTWLILCEDKTVISIHENPFPFAQRHLSNSQLQILEETRGNLKTVFRSLSNAHEESLFSQNPMTLLPIRTRLGTTVEETAHRESDVPGLLFYYLFENWNNSYTLVTRKESQYGIELDGLRREMLDQPKLVHVDRLDSIGNELRILKRHYESYDRMIDRLLEPQRATLTSLQNSHVLTAPSQASVETITPVVLEQESMMGVGLSSAARVRFKRLKDLIDLYGLSEVETYSRQKEALVTMNFNLIAIKQSLDVNRLTRITLLLTKTTILFLPVSLMTSYFTTELKNVEFSLQSYWIAFAVIFFASFLTLFLFGALNNDVQTLEVAKNIWGALKTGRKTRS